MCVSVCFRHSNLLGHRLHGHFASKRLHGHHMYDLANSARVRPECQSRPHSDAHIVRPYGQCHECGHLYWAGHRGFRISGRHHQHAYHSQGLFCQNIDICEREYTQIFGLQREIKQSAPHAYIYECHLDRQRNQGTFLDVQQKF